MVFVVLSSAIFSGSLFGQDDDPFAGVREAAPAPPPTDTRPEWRRLVMDNLGFRKELMSEFVASEHGQPYSRQSAGFEILKKFSTKTSTVGAFNFQGRLVRRDGHFQPVLNDMEGEDRPGWFFEYHNFYLDLYNIANPLLSDEARGRQVGRFNFRIGRFYVPFGINLQTDTHGPVLQLSNDRNFGFERDWYSGMWGSINRHLNYDVYYMAGSGYDLKFKGQSGLGALRISLGNRYSSQYGLEGGISVLGGERLASNSMSSTGHTITHASARRPVETQRVGLDIRHRRVVPKGSIALTSEISAGEDDHRRVFMQLYQGEFLHASRRWGLNTQYRRYRRDAYGADASVFGEFSWYLRNDVANSNLHWIKLNVERKVQNASKTPGVLVTLQYYFYW